SLFRVSSYHALEHSMHIADRWCQGVDSCFFHELSRFSWSREPLYAGRARCRGSRNRCRCRQSRLPQEFLVELSLMLRPLFSFGGYFLPGAVWKHRIRSNQIPLSRLPWRLPESE